MLVFVGDRYIQPAQRYSVQTATHPYMKYRARTESERVGAGAAFLIVVDGAASYMLYQHAPIRDDMFTGSCSEPCSRPARALLYLGYRAAVVTQIFAITHDSIAQQNAVGCSAVAMRYCFVFCSVLSSKCCRSIDHRAVVRSEHQREIQHRIVTFQRVQQQQQ